MLALAGASYLFAPGMSLSEVFGFVKGVEAFFFWQESRAKFVRLGCGCNARLKWQCSWTAGACCVAAASTGW